MNIFSHSRSIVIMTTMMLLMAFSACASPGTASEEAWLALESLALKGKINLKGPKHRYNKAKMWAKNQGANEIVGQMRIVITEGGNLVVNADGYTSAGEPYFMVSDDPDFSLLPRQKSQKVKVLLKKKNRKNLFFRLNAVVQYRPSFTLQLLHAADMDGATGAIENVKNFSALVEYFRSQRPETTLTLSSGDNYIPGPRYTAANDDSLIPLLTIPGNGRADISLLNAMGFQASAVGNHDLDGGTAEFASIINSETQQSGTYPGALFPYLSANLDFSTDAHLAELVALNTQPAETVANRLAGSTTIMVNGEVIGIVGASTPLLSTITSTGDITIYPEDQNDLAALAAEIQYVVDELLLTGVNKIILLSHMQQIGVEIELATLLDGVDVIVAGGSNTLLADENDTLRDGDAPATECVSTEMAALFNTSCTYPIKLKSITGEPVLVVNTDGDYKYLGRLVLGFDTSGVIIEESLDSTTNGAYASNDAMLVSVGNPAPVDEVVQLVDALSNVLIEREGNIFGVTTTYLDGRRGKVRTEETNMGNLSADANLWIAQMADPEVVVSLKNGGGIRDDIGYFAYPPGSVSQDDLTFYPPAANGIAGKQEGEISQFDIQGTLRFNNGLSLLTVTGEELVAIVEHSVAASDPGETPGRFPQVAGVRFSFDPSLPALGRVVNLVVEENGSEYILVRDGVLQGDPGKQFRMVTLNYLAGGGDGYPFPDRNRLDLVDSGLIPEDAGSVKGSSEGELGFAQPGSEQDALAEYLQEFHYPLLHSSSVPYAEVETPATEDQRIQNLMVRDDTILMP